MLAGILEAQRRLWERSRLEGSDLGMVQIVIDEAEQFLSKAAVGNMPSLAKMVRSITVHERKRRIGVVLSTQFPTHLNDEFIAAAQSAIVHQLNFPDTDELRRLYSRIRDEGGVEAILSAFETALPGVPIFGIIASFSQSPLSEVLISEIAEIVGDAEVEQMWHTLNFGKHEGLSLPQLIFVEPDYFIWGCEENIFACKGNQALQDQANSLYEKTRCILIPPPQWCRDGGRVFTH
tara:strand:- start:677 stop:1381 length:705 start_codon:yes stop_codon:yes gene_type:complete